MRIDFFAPHQTFKFQERKFKKITFKSFGVSSPPKGKKGIKPLNYGKLILIFYPSFDLLPTSGILNFKAKSSPQSLS